MILTSSNFKPLKSRRLSIAASIRSLGDISVINNLERMRGWRPLACILKSESRLHGKLLLLARHLHVKADPHIHVMSFYD